MNTRLMSLSSSKHNSFTVIVGILVAVVFILTLVFSIGASFNDHTYTVVVTDTERIVEKQKSSVTSKYLVFTRDVNTDEVRVFENTDNFIRLKFNSSDIQGSLTPGCTYEIKVVGWRLPLWSCYENILSVTPQ